MNTVLSHSKSGSITAASTAAAQGPDVPCRLVYLKARSTNTGTITILGISGTTIDSTGPIYALADPFPVLSISNLNLLAFKMSVSGEILDWVVIR